MWFWVNRKSKKKAMLEKEFEEEITNSEISEERYEHKRLVVDAGQSAVRIDKYLAERFASSSRTRIQDAIDSGFVWVNAQPTRANYKVRGNDLICIAFPDPPADIELIPEDIPLDIVYEDDHVLVLNKPTNMVVHPGSGNYSGTLVNALLHHFKGSENVQKGLRPGIVHRLDKHTSGIMVVAKTEYAHAHLSKQFHDKINERRYQALVWGDMRWKFGTIKAHVGRAGHDRKIFAAYPDGSVGKHAITHWRTIERFGYVTLVECKLETGRTHQIRVHFQHNGHPLFGDIDYGGKRIVRGSMQIQGYKHMVDNALQILPSQALHAKTLGFYHPENGHWMQFDSDLSPGMKQLIQTWRDFSYHTLKINQEDMQPV